MVEKLLCIFKISKKEKGSFSYIGWNVVQTSKEVFVDQNSYISSLKSVDLSTEIASQKDEELTIEEKTKLRSINGQLLWITSQTRPDDSFDICRVSIKIKINKWTVIVSNISKYPDASFDSCRVKNYGKKPKVNNLLRSNILCISV